MNKKKESINKNKNKNDNKNYINLKQYRYVESSCNRAFNKNDYKVERYTTKPKICYHIHNQSNPEQEITLNQSQ
eukprot:jgi/Orpsp1_1/1186673/evm.model.d7180000052444.2